MNRNNSPPGASVQESAKESSLITAPSISLPKGGGAIRGIGEKFAANPVTGTGSMTLPIATSPGRSGFGPQLALTYDSGSESGLFGLGWNLSVPAITRKTDKGLPQYLDDVESDVFLLGGAEDLVPVLDAAGRRPAPANYTVHGKKYFVRQYRPRIEGGFALIERWVREDEPTEMFWRTVSRENVTTWYGKSEDSRVVDPADAKRIFRWLACESHDDRGNVMGYGYLREDAAGVVKHRIEESNRNEAQRTANCYPNFIRYGNVKPYLPTLSSTGFSWPTPDDVPGQQWMFEVVFDYGNHPGLAPSTIPTAVWPVRLDPFSSHRAGFEVRTYRLCRRVLMFHHFATELGAPDCLVRSTDFEFVEPTQLADPRQPGHTVLRSVTSRTYQKRLPADATYESRQFPPVVFAYSESKVDPTVRTIAREEIDNLPVGTHGPNYQWIDLDGEGLSGVLSQQTGAWYYKPNLGDARFGATRVVASRPAMAALGPGRQQFLDLAGDGNVDLVDFNGPVPGFHERDQAEGWKRFVPFASLPNLNWTDPNLRFVDLTGDGHADALITEDEVFTWHPSRAEEGFSAAWRRPKSLDEEAGPQLVFAESTQTVFLADMCGDGLTDLVRIRNGEVCYWPNLGYGRFGRKITLGNSPYFDRSDQYDPRRLRLADIDGTGPVDLIYLGRNGAQLYFNRSGNGLSDSHLVEMPVATENLAAVQVADLLGNGTACLVWNSALPGDAQQPVRYIDLMGGATNGPAPKKPGKPHLLIRTDNNLGATTEIEYTPSTQFYLQDKRNGTPWITRLPFPVHCVSKVTARDKWRRTVFASTYSYHHGYFDGAEREFRGFGRVEQVDVESFGSSAENHVGNPFVTQDRTLYQPPVKTVTWFHTGAALENRRILNQFAHEYFPGRFADRLRDLPQFPAAFREKILSEPALPDDLSAGEWREALRACKGQVLRQEIYELDVDDLAAAIPRETTVRLFSAVAHNYRIVRLQSRGENSHALFLVTENEVLTYHYELALPQGTGVLEPDPRVGHTLTLRHDEQGNAQQSVFIGYGRWQPGDHGSLPRPDLITEVQSERHVTYSETRYTKDVVRPARVPGTTSPLRHHRLRLPCEVLTYEVKGVDPTDPHYFSISDFAHFDLSERYGHAPSETPPPRLVTRKEYHEAADGLAAQKRVVEQKRWLFFDDASDTAAPAVPLPFGQHGPRGFKYEEYKLALTEALLDAVFTRRDAVGNILDEKLQGELDAAAGVTPAFRARDALDRPIAIGSSYLQSGYIRGADLDGALVGQYWMRSGVAGFSDDAHEHFFLSQRYTGSFGRLTRLEYDGRDLFVRSTTDARGNTATVEDFDYRVLAPTEVVDLNGNHTASLFDLRGLVVALAMKGKRVNGLWEGDSLSGFDFDSANPPPDEVTAFCTAPTANRVQAATWLGNATTRFIYHFGDEAGSWAQRPSGACTLARERHASEVAFDPTLGNPLQILLECSDGSGGALMKKIQAEPESTGGAARWIISGLTVLNNKGKAVKQYEPTFVAEFGCQLPAAFGVSPTFYYDAVGRLVRTEFADGTVSRVEFSPWHFRSFDQNDAVKASRWYRERLTATERGQPLFAPGASAPEQAEANAAEASAAVADPSEKRAAKLAANHAETPAITILDSLGREVIAVAHNRTPDANDVWQNLFSLTFTKLDPEGKPLWVRDARSNLAMQYLVPPKADNDAGESVPGTSVPAYDIAGNLLYQHGLDTGDRWTLPEAAGKPMLTWELNGQTHDDGSVVTERRLFYARYDTLHRPTEHWLKIDDHPRALVEASEYLDADSFKDSAGVVDQVAFASAQGNNLLGQAGLYFDSSGLITAVRLNFKGAVEEVARSLVRDAKVAVVDWNVPDRQLLLEGERFHQVTQYDALGRMTRLYNWHLESSPGASDRVAVYEPEYNERGLLKSEKLHVRARKLTANGRAGFTEDPDPRRKVKVIERIGWNAKGQKLQLALGNGTVTHYRYDPKSFRLRGIYTRRGVAFSTDCGGEPPPPRTAAPDKDPPPLSCGVQNLSYVHDPVGNILHVQDDAQQVIYFQNARVDPSNDYIYDALYQLLDATGREDGAFTGAPVDIEGPSRDAIPAPDVNAVRRYRQQYRYDLVGNLEEMNHAAGANGSWSRHYSYAPNSNRLTSTWQGSNPGAVTQYQHDFRGNILNLANVAEDQRMRWDYRDMIHAVKLGGAATAYYCYNAEKQRSRKRVEDQNGFGGYWERIYLGGFERYRRYDAADLDHPVEEIESVHVFEGEQRVLLLDDVIVTDNPRLSADSLYRYQYGNALGSATLELDHAAEIVSYEEYHPYGSCAYRAKAGRVEVPLKRYRYTGMERDEETGLNYHTARYYVPWLGRWASGDPAGLVDGPNVFVFVRNNPLRLTDRGGRQAKTAYSDMSSEEKVTMIQELTAKGYLVEQAVEYLNSPSNCQKVAEKCKEKFPTSAIIDAKIKEAKKQYSRVPEPAQKNMDHYLGNTGTEMVMPSKYFEKRPEIAEALSGKWRDEFKKGVEKRLKDGRLDPSAKKSDLKMSYTGLIEPRSTGFNDEVAVSVGSFQLQATVDVTVTQTGPGKYHVEFNQSKNQIFDVYNWDPGKSAAIDDLKKKAVGLPTDSDMCCVENAGKGKAFLVTSEPWITKDKKVLQGLDITIDLPDPPTPQK